MITIRTGQAPAMLDRQFFGLRFCLVFVVFLFVFVVVVLVCFVDVAWQAYITGRKSPRTERVGADFENPDFELSSEWLATRRRLLQAQEKWSCPETPTRVLLVCGAARNDGTCPGEMSKTFRLLSHIRETVMQDGVETDVLDLSLLASEYGRHIHPCKGCVSTAMPLCHWPCSCYPNHGLNQTNDWMAEIYERWTAAHAVGIVTPVYWYQSPSPLKLMIDRLVCADGGNPDPTRTAGKDPALAKDLEMAGWDYPKHLAGRVYGLLVHGDVAGIESSRRALSDWLDWMGLIDAGPQARLDRYIGYYEPYADSHDTLDRDAAVQEEAGNVGRAVVHAVTALRAGQWASQRPVGRNPRPK